MAKIASAPRNHTKVDLKPGGLVSLESNVPVAGPKRLSRRATAEVSRSFNNSPSASESDVSAWTDRNYLRSSRMVRVNNGGTEVIQQYAVGKGNKKGAWGNVLNQLGVSLRYGDFVWMSVRQDPKTGVSELKAAVTRGALKTRYRGFVIPSTEGVTVMPAPAN